MNNIFKINNLKCVIANKIIIKNINVSIYSKDILIIHGPNGSGKSTFLRCLAGFIPIRYSIDSLFWNKICIKDNISIKWLQNKIHYLNNNNPFIKELSILQNIKYWSNLNGFSSYILDSINELGMNNIINKPINSLSMGQEKKLNIIRLLCSHRPIWLLDEPTIGLDKKSLLVLSKIIKKHQSDGGITLIATHQEYALNINPTNKLYFTK